MSISDELREWAKEFWEFAYGKFGDKARLLAIADRIDAEHKKACDDAWDNGYEADYLGIKKWLTEHPQVMEHHGWIRLPKDADGEPIHVGDVMESKGSGLLFDKASFEVRIMRCDECGWEVYDRLGDRYEPSLLRHYHAPTVEDVLRQVIACANNGTHVHGALDTEQIVAEYAAKLRLAEEEDA